MEFPIKIITAKRWRELTARAERQDAAVADLQRIVDGLQRTAAGQASRIEDVDRRTRATDREVSDLRLCNRKNKKLWQYTGR